MPLLTMAAKDARYIQVPTYIVKLGLLYALLITSGLMLAWVTIYRHEKSISELRSMLISKQAEQRKSLPAAVKDDEGEQNEDLENYKQELTLENHDSGQRFRRHRKLKENDQDTKDTKPHQHLKGQKGERGPRGKRGKRGKPGSKGEMGPRGPPGAPGPQGVRGPHGVSGPAGQQGYPGPRGDRGNRGEEGQKGEPGQKGDKGEMGRMGKRGSKGDKGDHGIPGMKGSKGDQGREGRMFSESAHIVGQGRMVKSAPHLGEHYRVISWTPKHRSGSITYKNGYLKVEVDGVYFIYGQMYYFDGKSSYTGFNIYIDDNKVLRAIYSVVNKDRKYHTQYISGIFRIHKGQKISIGTTITRSYFFNESSSFFGTT